MKRHSKQCLRASIEDIKEYCRLCRLEENQENLTARYKILLKQRDESYKRLEEAKATVEYMNYKMKHYEDILARLIPDDSNPGKWAEETRPKLY